MESLLPASGSTFQLILEHLRGALVVVSESLTNVPGLPAFPWEILVCAVMLVVIVKRQHTFRSVTLLGKRSSAHDEACSENENVGPRHKLMKSSGPLGWRPVLPCYKPCAYWQ